MIARWSQVVLLFLLLCGVTLGASEPRSVVITYEGELTEFPRYLSGDRFVVEIPNANRSRLVRGDLSTCSASGNATVWSFPNPEGTQANLRNIPGRIEIIFTEGPLVAQTPTTPAAPLGLPEEAPAAPTQDLRLALGQSALLVSSGSTVSNANLLAPIAEAPVESMSGPREITAASLADRSISVASFALDVPDSPAFAALGISPENVVRPSNPQELVASMLNGVDRNGNFQSGVALDTAPYLLFFGKDVTLESYQRSYITRLLTRTQFSFATSKGTEADDPSTRLALGLHLTLLDRGDPRFDVDLQRTYDNIDAEVRRQRGPIPPGVDMQLEADRREAAMRPLFKEAFAAARQRNWNRTNLSLGFAPSWISPEGDGEEFRWNGATVWTSLAYGFEGIPVLEKSSQLILHARYRDHEEVPDPEKEGEFIRQNSLLFGGRLRMGTVDTNASVDGAWIREWGGGREYSVGRLAVGLERRMTKNLWLSVTAGKEFGNEDRKDALTVLANFKLGFGDDPPPMTTVSTSSGSVAMRDLSNETLTTSTPAGFTGEAKSVVSSGSTSSSVAVRPGPSATPANLGGSRPTTPRPATPTPPPAETTKKRQQALIAQIDGLPEATVKVLAKKYAIGTPASSVAELRDLFHIALSKPLSAAVLTELEADAALAAKVTKTTHETRRSLISQIDRLPEARVQELAKKYANADPTGPIAELRDQLHLAVSKEQDPNVLTAMEVDFVAVSNSTKSTHERRRALIERIDKLPEAKVQELAKKYTKANPASPIGELRDQLHLFLSKPLEANVVTALEADFVAVSKSAKTAHQIRRSIIGRIDGLPDTRVRDLAKKYTKADPAGPVAELRDQLHLAVSNAPEANVIAMEADFGPADHSAKTIPERQRLLIKQIDELPVAKVQELAKKYTKAPPASPIQELRDQLHIVVSQAREAKVLRALEADF